MRIVKVISSGYNSFNRCWELYAMVRVGVGSDGSYSHEYRRFVFPDRASLDRVLSSGIVLEGDECHG